MVSTVGLAPEVREVISAVLGPSEHGDDRFFSHVRLGEVYRSYVIAQFLDPRHDSGPRTRHRPAARAAKVFSLFRLTGDSSERWIQVYEHTCTVVAAALTIAKRMSLPDIDIEKIRSAALLHDATKRIDVERFGQLANSRGNANRALERTMRDVGYDQETIQAATNTGREDRVFGSAVLRRQSIAAKGVAAAIVGLADARAYGAEFLSLDRARALYLSVKLDAESQQFFGRYWLPYYQDVEAYLRAQCASLDLAIDDAVIYRETIFSEVLGKSPSAGLRARYSYSR